MLYTRCTHAGRMPKVMNENAKIWNIFNFIRNNLLFRHYPFLLKSYFEGLQLHFSESELRRLGYIYSLYVNETVRKYPPFFLPALINL
jgi:hypothetical protein